MRILPSFSPFSTSNFNKKGETQTQNKGFATKAFVATATVSTALLFSSVATANGENGDSHGKKEVFNLPKKFEDKYGIEYKGYDSYPGLHLDDGTGVATEETKSASTKIVSKALDAAGLNDMMKGISSINAGEDITLHPKYAHRIGVGTCPSYGCPFLPLDVHYDADAKAQLENMRSPNTNTKSTTTEDRKEYVIKSSGSKKAATLTLMGYKGGRLEDQINQDRAFALAPYLYWNIKSSSGGESDGDSARTWPVARLIGSFDGHAKFGEKVSEYVAKTLPALLGSKLVNIMASKSDGDEVDRQQFEGEVGQILHEVFLELDATSPADPSGGCTASAVLQLGTKIYIANAGDSRSFVAVHILNPAHNDAKLATTTIIYGTREDKPHLKTERERVEHMGGTVLLPNGFLETGTGTTRVVYQDPTTGRASGLAMSRSIGDWDAGAVGVIPDPLIDILDIKEIKKRVLAKMNDECKGNSTEIEVCDSSAPPCVKYTEKDVKVFAISATDGLLDYLPEQEIANHVAKGLYGTTLVNPLMVDSEEDKKHQTTHPLLVCEDLIYAAADGWQKSKGGAYRDDIAIAVADLEIE